MEKYKKWKQSARDQRRSRRRLKYIYKSLVKCAFKFSSSRKWDCNFARVRSGPILITATRANLYVAYKNAS